MSFEIEGKVALVTGGASGIGLCYVKELLRHGAKGVTIADINIDLGHKVLDEIHKEFGLNKAIFVSTDVSDKENFEDAFKKTIEQFKNIDILINNAGIASEVDYERVIAVNLNGTLYGMLLGFENYLQKYQSGSGGVIVNIASIAIVSPFAASPVYTATKFAVFGMSKAWGCEEHYQRTKVKILCICPDITDTPLLIGLGDRLLGPAYKKMCNDMLDKNANIRQKPEYVAKSVMKLIANAKNGSAWVISPKWEPYEFVLPPSEDFVLKK